MFWSRSSSDGKQIRTINPSSPIPRAVIQELQDEAFTLPFRSQLVPPATYESLIDDELEIRCMKWQDIPTMAKMAYDEYGGVPSASATPEDGLLALKKSVVRFLESIGDPLLIPYVQFALFAKLFLAGLSTQPRKNLDLEGVETYNSTNPAVHKSNSTAALDTNVPLDHLVLVAEWKGRGLVGWVDLSRHWVDPSRNPPIVPQPTWWKEWQGQSKSTTLASDGFVLQGWLANLLVAPQYRGQGWAKVLVLACEATARTYWNKGSPTNLVSSIHLHCDAHPVRGRIPQRLYQSLGYKMGTGERSGSGDLATGGWASSIYVIDDVPLLYMNKQLEKNNNLNKGCSN